MAVTDTTTSAGLLAFCKTMARRPASDVEMTNDDWYTLLTEAQSTVYRIVATHVPEVLYGAPQQLSTSDNKVYTFPSSVFPFGKVEIRASRDGRLLRPGPEYDDGADFTWEGDQIRIPSNKEKTFDDGPYARFVSPPGTLDASNPPTLKPPQARVLIAYEALSLFAHRGGGQRDPSFYESLFQKAWEGNGRFAGDTGILGMLKSQGFGVGVGASIPPGAFSNTTSVA